MTRDRKRSDENPGRPREPANIAAGLFAAIVHSWANRAPTRWSNHRPKCLSWVEVPRWPLYLVEGLADRPQSLVPPAAVAMIEPGSSARPRRRRWLPASAPSRPDLIGNLPSIARDKRSMPTRTGAGRRSATRAARALFPPGMASPARSLSRRWSRAAQMRSSPCKSNPPKELHIDAQRVKQMLRIIPYDELLAV
ncbi:hypothetical protein FG93_04534 [Bosea sp. LC85]|nr:hypothetical protein FG93_04534 [Bosea sp. LC85]